MPRRILPGQPAPVFLDLDAPPAPLAPDMPLEAYARRWLTRQCRRLKRRSRETYRWTLELHLLPALGPDTPLVALRRDRIADVLLAKLAAGYQPRTVWLAYKVLRAMLTAARLDDGLLRENPTERVSRLLPPRNDQPATVATFEPGELRALLTAARRVHPKMAAMFVLAARTGMRLGECLGLTWGAVDLEQRLVSVRYTLDRHRELGTPKGGRSVSLPLSREAVAVLRELHDNPKRPRVAWVFCNPRTGRPWARVYVRRVLHRACLRADLAPRSMHAFRHTFLTQLAAAGVNPWTIRDLARHRSIVTTEGYLHLNRQHLALVDALEATEP